MTVDNWSKTSFPIQILGSGEQELAQGTAFLWGYGDDVYLVTNMHLINFCNPRTGTRLDEYIGTPISIKAWFHGNVPGAIQTAVYPLYDESFTALWSTHPTLKETGDLAILQISPPPNIGVTIVNSHFPTIDKIEIGKEVFILGYPFGLSVGEFPIWKRASVASELIQISSTVPYFFVDTATRPGMSGSPVIRRTTEPYFHNGFSQAQSGNYTVEGFIGIYSGRIGVAGGDVQLGMVWPAKLIRETVTRHLES